MSNIEVVVQTGLATAEGLAVDWIGENLYWVESNLDQIEVAKLNGSFRRTLVAGDMESPRAIALDPRNGLLFWTDWDLNAPRIERCTMAGQHRLTVVFVDELTNGAWPNGLTLDYTSRRIYWIDARSVSIHTTNYDGKDHHEVIRDHEKLSHPFAIALFENFVYWTDWRTNNVFRANKWNGKDITLIQRTSTQPFDIKILHPSRQPNDYVSPCKNNNGGCSHLCLLNGNHTYKCDCPHVMSLAVDQKTCLVNERVMLFSRSKEIRGVDLNQPYYHTIPTISLPQVMSPSQIDFYAATSNLYWTDIQYNEVKRAGLTSRPTQTVIDTGIDHPSGLAIDWISSLLFVSSAGSTFNHISVYNLNGEFCSIVVSGDDLFNVKSIALDPTRGSLYWSHHFETYHMIESAAMDGSKRNIIVNQTISNEVLGPQSLTMDLESWRLYWINVDAYTVQYYDFETQFIHEIILKENTSPSAITVYNGMLYYANTLDDAIHVANKTTGQNDTVFRNNTDHVLSLKVYDPKLQIGNNSCSKNRGGCEHLCLPVTGNEHRCRCAIGYYSDPVNVSRCIAIDELIIYSINWEIRGLPLRGGPDTVLIPISKVSMASSIDFVAGDGFIYWADSDHGTITRIKRDGTKRYTIFLEYFLSSGFNISA